MKKIQLILLICAALTFVPAAIASTSHAFLWSSESGMIDLGTLGGDCYAMGINDSEEVVGWSVLADGVTIHAFVWTASSGMVDIGTLPGGSQSQAWAVNSSGQVVGTATAADGKVVAFSWTASGGFQPLKEADAEDGGVATAINESGTIMGLVRRNDVLRAFYWSPDLEKKSLIASRPAPLAMTGAGINSLGHITGAAYVLKGWKAFFWSRQRGVIALPRLHQVTQLYGQSINDHDEVVGTAYATDSSGVAFYWKPGAFGLATLQTLGGSGSYAYGINNSGAIVGSSDSPSEAASHAVVWPNFASAPRDLGTLPGGIQSYGDGINSVGEVVGGADVP